MRRALLQVFLFPSRRPLLRRLLRARGTPLIQSSGSVRGGNAVVTATRGVRTAARRPSSSSSTHRRTASASAAAVLPASSMQLRSFSAALVAAAVAGGAWYYKALTPLHADSGQTSTRQGYPYDLTDDAVSARKALLVEDGQIFTATITGDGPLFKDTDGRRMLEMLTPDQATLKLRRNEESWFIGRGKGVVRYDVVQIPSNDPIEDDHAEKIIQVPDTVAATGDGANSSDWMFWGVFDGHSGWTTSAKLRQSLIQFVARELNTTYTSALSSSAMNSPTAEAIDSAIKKAFTLLDNEITHESVRKVHQAKSKLVAAELLAPALSGSCALLSFYDSNSKLLRVACTGDSRAVLGRRGANGKWTAVPLSIDQTGANEEEANRMRKEHPNEPNVVLNGRVLGGLEPTRAFGDAIYKWTLETQDKLKKSYFGRTPNRYMRSPPYVTAEPVVTTTKVNPENGDFVVMATDGLWEMLTNEEVVGLVGRWLEHQNSTKSGSSPSAESWLKGWFSATKQGQLPVEGREANAQDPTGQRPPLRRQQWGIDEKLDRFVVEDKNVATHLVRNALGGKDSDQLCALLTLPSPHARRYRDDLTVEVIFFGDEKAEGNVTMNSEASAAARAAKPKL